MKELSIEEKARAYDEALALMVDCVPDEDGLVHVRPHEIFQELAESEDERIRKELSKDIWNYIPYEKAQKYITWLKKQDKPKDKSVLEVWKDMRLEVYQQASGNRHEPNYSDDTTKMFSLNDIDEIIEKMSEQKSADKAGPKFKVGDWITNGRYNKLIVGINSDWPFYMFKDGTSERIKDVDEKYHLWTIHDARDGDVLAGSRFTSRVGNKEDVILMFRGIGNTEWDDVIDFHCYYDCYQKDFIVQEDVEYWGNAENNQLVPATKGQRELLFSKMKDAGYDWDAEKKELKKIEDEEYNGYDY